MNKNLLYILILFFLGSFLFRPAICTALLINPPPYLLDPVQLKSDNETLIQEGGITTEGTVIFRARVFNPPENNAILEVELRKITEPFTGIDDGGILRSNSAPSGTTVFITIDNLINGQYHWRVRTVDPLDPEWSFSEWQEFGETPSFDFEVKAVQLYTQVFSQYPSEEETKRWFNETYANGRGAIDPDGPGPEEPCGLTIARCGCAITSAVMILRYHDVTSAIDGQDTNPLNFNNWLNNNNGYGTLGDLKWQKVAEYSKTSPTGLARIHYDGSKNFPDLTTLDLYLTSLNPVILYNSPFGHFLVADGKLGDTYRVKDPGWYGTKKLDEEATNPSTRIRDYNNQFAGLRLYSPLIAGGPVDGISLTLASPAELLVTDSLGYRLGKNPITNDSYSEITGGIYYQEGIGNAESEIPIVAHQIKTIWIPQPIPNNEYNIKVIGTGAGTYTLESLVYDSQSQPHFQEIQGETQVDLTTDYNLNFTPDEPENIIIQPIQPIDTTPPEAKIYFDKDNKTLKIEGVDDITQNPEVTVTTQDITFTSSELKEIETDIKNEGKNNGLGALTLLLNRLNWEKKKVIYQIKDEAGNTLVLTFKRITDKRFFIYARLESLQYNSDPVIILSKTILGYLWFPDKKPLFIFQGINVKNQFSVGALYNSIKNQTTIVTNKQKQTLSGLKIIKLITKSGLLDFEF